MKIERIIARQIIDSRGNPTIEADVWLEGGVFGRAAVPSGASTGVHEAHELRDGGKPFNGLGVSRAVENVNAEIMNALRGMSADDQNLIDKTMIELDGTPNKSRLGANSILAVSLACAHAAAKARGVLLYSHINDIAGNPKKSLPMPMMNVLNGGKHATGSSDFQEFMLVPKGAETFRQAVQMGSEIFHSLKKRIEGYGVSSAVGDEGGFTFPIQSSNTEMLQLLSQAVDDTEYKLGEEVVFAMDIAASEFFVDSKYNLATEKRTLSTPEMIEYLKSIVEHYPVVSIEDGLSEDDWSGWTELTKQLSSTQLVGDDLLVTNVERLQKALSLKAANAILIKPNQIGTLSETIAAISLAHQNNWRTIVSHRSGETEDSIIADLAVGMGCEQIKTGSICRGERTAKYNQLLRIEEELGSSAVYWGTKAFKL